jgi:hypothetical protein
VAASSTSINPEVEQVTDTARGGRVRTTASAQSQVSFTDRRGTFFEWSMQRQARYSEYQILADLVGKLLLTGGGPRGPEKAFSAEDQALRGERFMMRESLPYELRLAGHARSNPFPAEHRPFAGCSGLCCIWPTSTAHRSQGSHFLVFLGIPRRYKDQKKPLCQERLEEPALG